MNINYQKVLEDTLNNISKTGKTPSLLLHACCAPCSSYCLEYLSSFFNITILYYNPNIYPDDEYNRRLSELKDFLKSFLHQNEINLMECDYNPDEYYKNVKGLEKLGERSKRCYECYKFRMDKCAKLASDNHFDYFTTTLSISPYKDAKWINEIGEILENKYNVKYLYADFKKKNGYKRSIELSKEYNLYRQDYCGCVYSKLEHDKKRK